MRRGPACGPPITHPAVALSTTNSTAASNAPVPESSDSSRQCTPGSSVTTRTMLAVDTRRSGSCSRAASSGRRARNASPISNGASTVKINVRTIAPALTVTPSKRMGSTRGWVVTPTNSRITTRPTASAGSPLISVANLTSTGPPGAVANTSSDAVSTGSSSTKRETPRAITGSTTKLASSARTSQRRSWSETEMSRTVSIRPTPSMVETTNARTSSCVRVWIKMTILRDG